MRLYNCCSFTGCEGLLLILGSTLCADARATALPSSCVAPHRGSQAVVGGARTTAACQLGSFTHPNNALCYSAKS